MRMNYKKNLKNSRFLTLLIIFMSISPASAQSVAGLYQIPASGRIVYNFNQGWRFFLGDVDEAEAPDFDDSNWDIVCAPHTARLEPAACSGGRNYQGICWYRKTFTLPADMEGKDAIVYFEAIMGKQDVFINGKLATQHLGGYLPIIVHLNKFGVKPGEECVVAVRANNTDDKTYPPGKKQSQLDFAYHAGMYRDVWLIGKSEISITDPIEADKVAGGGVFVHYGEITKEKAEIFVDLDIKNPHSKNYSVMAMLKDATGKTIKIIEKVIKAKAKSKGKANPNLYFTLNNPHLWSPESPYLYNLELRIEQNKNPVDGGMVRLGIRRAEFKGKDGFWLNNKPYHQLIGGNRHQDFAYVGNALPNSQQWRDAKRLKDAGMNIIRAAHYPQDPSFMDACDELGIFIIVPTPGWQYWNKDSTFAQLVHKNTREIIRRDRNHPCVLMWEPILNETRYPLDFALQAHQITIDEFPYPGRPVAAADMNSAGVKENYEVLYGWPEDVGQDTDKCIFTREFGEMVDDWYAHNCINRAARHWGEKPMLDAANSLAKTYSEMCTKNRQFIGGCQWHPFDHQRGYHPDPYYGGIYDAFRQKKYAFEMFRSQVSTNVPMVFIANEMTQFSSEDVTVFSNCDSVRLTFLEGKQSMTLPVEGKDLMVDGKKIRQSRTPVVFKSFWNFWDARELSYKQRNWQKVSLLAEGIMNGKVVCTEKKMPARRNTKLRLYADEMGKKLIADGSDFIVIVAEVTDDNGNVRRLAKEEILFDIEGEGRIIGDASIGANPRTTEWGSAPILVQSTTTPGTIKITARPLYEGIHAPAPDTLAITSVAANLPHVEGTSLQQDFLQLQTDKSPFPTSSRKNKGNVGRISQDEKRYMLEEVEQQQKDFGTTK